MIKHELKRLTSTGPNPSARGVGGEGLAMAAKKGGSNQSVGHKQQKRSPDVSVSLPSVDTNMRGTGVGEGEGSWLIGKKTVEDGAID